MCACTLACGPPLTGRNGPLEGAVIKTLVCLSSVAHWWNVREPAGKRGARCRVGDWRRLEREGAVGLARSVRRAPWGRLAATPPPPASSEQPRGHRAGPGHARALAARPGPRACPGSTARPPERPRRPCALGCRPRAAGSVSVAWPALGVYFSPRWCKLGLDVPLSCQRKPPRCADRAPRTDTAGPRRALLHVGASERRGDGHVARGPRGVALQPFARRTQSRAPPRVARPPSLL